MGKIAQFLSNFWHNFNGIMCSSVGLFGQDFRRTWWYYSLLYFITGYFFMALIVFTTVILKDYEILSGFLNIICVIGYFIYGLRGAFGLVIETPAFINSLLPYQLIGTGVAVSHATANDDGSLSIQEVGTRPYWYKGFISKKRMQNFISSGKRRMIGKMEMISPRQFCMQDFDCD